MKYLSKENTQDYWGLDIETDSLTPTVIWCCCVRNLETEEEITFFNKEVFNAWVKDVNPIFIGHNILGFDIPALGRLWGLDSSRFLDNSIDTLVLSYLYSPALEIPEELVRQNQELGEKKGPHGLEAWGFRLKYPKGDYSDWSQLTPEMVEYCRQDVRLTLRVYEALKIKMLKLGYSELSCKIEHDVKVIIEEQISNGCYFDEARAKEFRDFLLRRQADLSESIRGLFPKRREKVAEYTFRRRKDGSPTASYETHRDKYSDVVHIIKDGVEWYECYELVPFNLGSPQQRLQRLLELGWEPVTFTPKGNPKVDEDALLAFAEASGRQEVKALAEWLVVTARLSMLAGNPKTGSLGWLGYSRNGRIHGKVFSCGAASRRMTHNSPNTANPPSVKKAKYGKEMRSLWGVEPGRGLCMIGYDAKGLETECFKHWLNSPAANKILDGDIHTDNAKALSALIGREVDREWGAKTCVPLDTKALTRRGWKHHDELIIGEEILGYNSETKRKEWTKLRDITRYNDEVFSISNSHREFRATGNHRWFVRQRKKGLNSWSKINGHYMEDQIRTTDELNSESSIIVNAPFNETQDKTSICSWIKDQKYGIDWEQRVLDMSHEERRQFLQGFLLADGHMVESDHWAWSQNKNEIAEALILASYLVNDGQIHVAEKNGYNENMYTVTLAKKGHVTCSKFKKESLGFQPVWCPTTDLGSWVMRQGNEITITGNCWYAWMFGCYPPKLMTILKCSKEHAEQIFEELFPNRIPGLKKFIKEIQYEWKSNKGRLGCIDGGMVVCPSQSSALNYKIQPTGAVVMKLSSILIRQTTKDKGVWNRKLLDVHDEGQHEALEKDMYLDGETTRHPFGDIAVSCITRAGVDLGFNVPLTGSYSVGMDWSQTH